MFNALQLLTADGRLLFATRFVRLFAYGALSVVLVLYLVGLGFSEADTGVLLTATLMGDTLVSLYLTTQADRIGRRLTLIAGTALMVAAGLVLIACMPLKSTGVAIRMRLRSGRSGLRAAESRLSTPPKQ